LFNTSDNTAKLAICLIFSRFSISLLFFKIENALSNVKLILFQLIDCIIFHNSKKVLNSSLFTSIENLVHLITKVVHLFDTVMLLSGASLSIFAKNFHAFAI